MVSENLSDRFCIIRKMLGNRFGAAIQVESFFCCHTHVFDGLMYDTFILAGKGLETQD